MTTWGAVRAELETALEGLSYLPESTTKTLVTELVSEAVTRIEWMEKS